MHPGQPPRDRVPAAELCLIHYRLRLQLCLDLVFRYIFWPYVSHIYGYEVTIFSWEWSLFCLNFKKKSENVLNVKIKSYICGLEIEEPTGDNIIDYLETLDATIFFAPGPRILSIPQAKLDHLFKLSPVIHLNEQEITSYTKTPSIEEACLQLSKLTNNDIIVTLGEEGAYYYHDYQGIYIPGNPSTVVDTIGAGDSHLGSYMAALQMNYSPIDAIALANKIASQVVQIEGASLTKEQFKRVFN